MGARGLAREPERPGTQDRGTPGDFAHLVGAFAGEDARHRLLAEHAAQLAQYEPKDYHPWVNPDGRFLRFLEEKAFKRVQKEARLPGFRKGKVPSNMIKLHFSDDVRQEVARHVPGAQRVPDHDGHADQRQYRRMYALCFCVFLLVVMVGHATFRQFDPAAIAARTPARVLVDLRGLYPRPNWEAAGFRFFQLGGRRA